MLTNVTPWLPWSLYLAAYSFGGFFMFREAIKDVFAGRFDIEEVPVEQLCVGDVVIVKPNERLAADGFVIKGEGSVNQAPITGESIPVDKRAVEDSHAAAANPDRLEPQYRAFAGTINGSGALEIQVTKLASESTLARVVQMVNEAETQKSPTQRFADKFERYFVPAVLTISSFTSEKKTSSLNSRVPRYQMGWGRRSKD